MAVLKNKNLKLDLDYVRSQFPAFNDKLAKNWSFFENAGGSYVPQNVIDKLTEFMISTKVQPYAEYDMSKIAGENMDKATKLFAQMINAKENEILIGGSTSINLYVLIVFLILLSGAASCVNLTQGKEVKEDIFGSKSSPKPSALPLTQ